MDAKQGRGEPANQVPSDSEIEAATQRLSQQWARPAAPARVAAKGQILQSLARGRSRTVTVEVKRLRRQRSGFR